MSKLHFADFISNLMKEKGETSVELSAQIGVPVTTLKSWFQRNSFPADALKKLAQRFRLPSEMYDLQQRFEVKVARTSRAHSDAADVRQEYSDAMPITVDGPLDYPHWAFVERLQTEVEALELLKKEVGHPIGIVGGPKAGKSSALRYLAEQMSDQRYVAEVDLAGLSTQLSSKDEAAVEDALADAFDSVMATINPQSKRLRDINKLGPWFAGMIADTLADRPILLLLDGAEHLPPPAYQRLAVALHQLKNYANRSVLRRLELVYTFDHLIQKKQEAKDESFSSHLMGRYGIMIDVHQFGERQIESLLEIALKPRIPDPMDRVSCIRRLLKLVYEGDFKHGTPCSPGVHGHPYLTQLWLRNLLAHWTTEQEPAGTWSAIPQGALDSAMEEAQAAVHQLQHAAATGGMSNDALKDFSEIAWSTENSGYMVERSTEDSDQVECAKFSWKGSGSKMSADLATALRHSCLFHDRRTDSICTTRWLEWVLRKSIA